MVERTRLLDVLRETGQRRLVFVHGPAGFGKTTLAIQWARRLEADGVAVAWLTVDSDDDNVVWFLSHSIQAIRRVRPDLARELAGQLDSMSPDVVQSILSTLIDEIHDSGRGMVLAVHDWHRIRSAETVDALRYLLLRGRRDLRFVITSRGRAGLPLEELLTHDELVEIDADALRFDLTEATEFLVDHSGLSLSADDVTRLQESTEGWPAALQLVQLSLAGRDDPAEFIGNLSGRQHVIGEYLTDNVLASLESSLVDFLMATSGTARICADLATALVGRSDSQQLLDQVADANLFLQRTDDTGEWFHYHRMFADHLQRKLQQQDPDRVTLLHTRASAWFADHGMLIEAVDHALAADDPHRAVDLVEAHAMDLVEDFRLATLLGLMAKLPRPLTDLRPRLQLCVGWANIGLGRGELAQAALRNVVTALETGDIPADNRAALQVEVTLATAMDRNIRDHIERLPDSVIDRVDGLARPILSVLTSDLSAADALNRFDYADVERWHRSSIGFGTAAMMAQYSHCIVGLAAWEQFDAATAERHFTVELTVPDDADMGIINAPLQTIILLGDLRYQQGRLSEAEALLQRGAAVLPHAAIVDFLLTMYGTTARLATCRGDLARAEQLLATGTRLAEERSLPRLAARMINERIRAGMPLPDRTRAQLLNLPPYRACADRVHAHTAELGQDSAIRLLLAERAPAATAKACEQARHLVAEIGRQNRLKALVQARLLYACCLWDAGWHDEAREIADPALSLCSAQGVRQFADDAGPGIGKLGAVMH